MIATYENVSAGQGQYSDSATGEDGKYYIYVKTEDEIFGYIIEYYISLKQDCFSSRRKGRRFTIYKMAVNDEYIERPPITFSCFHRD